MPRNKIKNMSWSAMFDPLVPSWSDQASFLTTGLNNLHVVKIGDLTDDTDRSYFVRSQRKGGNSPEKNVIMGALSLGIPSGKPDEQLAYLAAKTAITLANPSYATDLANELVRLAIAAGAPSNIKPALIDFQQPINHAITNSAGGLVNSYSPPANANLILKETADVGNAKYYELCLDGALSTGGTAQIQWVQNFYNQFGQMGMITEIAVPPETPQITDMLLDMKTYLGDTTDTEPKLYRNYVINSAGAGSMVGEEGQLGAEIPMATLGNKTLTDQSYGVYAGPPRSIIVRHEFLDGDFISQGELKSALNNNNYDQVFTETGLSFAYNEMIGESVDLTITALQDLADGQVVARMQLGNGIF